MLLIPGWNRWSLMPASTQHTVLDRVDCSLSLLDPLSIPTLSFSLSLPPSCSYPLCFFSVSKRRPECHCLVTMSYLTFCDPMDCSIPGFPVLHYFKFMSIDDAIQPSHSLPPFSSCPQYFSASGFFPVSQLFTSGGQSIRASTSTSVLSVNIQDWFPLGLTGLIWTCWHKYFNT